MSVIKVSLRSMTCKYTAVRARRYVERYRKLKLGGRGNMWVWNLRHVELVVRARYKVQVCTIAGVERMYLSHETAVCSRKEKALREREAWKEKVGWLQAGPRQGEVD